MGQLDPFATAHIRRLTYPATGIADGLRLINANLADAAALTRPVSMDEMSRLATIDSGADPERAVEELRALICPPHSSSQSDR